MKINFLLNWTRCSDNRDANLRDRASLSWRAADTSCFTRRWHRALPFLCPFPFPHWAGNLLGEGTHPPEPPNSFCRSTCRKRQSMWLLPATARLLEAGLIVHLSVRSSRAHTHVQVHPPPPFVKLYQIHMAIAKGKQKKDPKVWVFFGFSYKSKRNSVLWQLYHTDTVQQTISRNTFAKQRNTWTHLGDIRSLINQEHKHFVMDSITKTFLPNTC